MSSFLYSLLDVVVASFSQSATLDGEIDTGFMHSSFITIVSSFADISNGKIRPFPYGWMVTLCSVLMILASVTVFFLIVGTDDPSLNIVNVSVSLISVITCLP